MPTTAPLDVVRECLPQLSLVDVVVLADAVLRLREVNATDARAAWAAASVPGQGEGVTW